MFQIMYISSAHEVCDQEIDDILSASRRNNRRDEISGLLLYNGHRFLQVLEGPEASVKGTFDRIKLDPRHRASVLLSAKTVIDRQFGHWDMACERFTDDGGRQALIAAVDALVAQVTDPNLRAEFTSYVRLHA